ncbi:MAG: family transcriptional regulator [Microbacteriaceae bacterium]|jgi:transcriptional regulator with XRE-family HTH domain|nr:family transcriptional regulator [Microbacteriaceae bacterium]
MSEPISDAARVLGDRIRDRRTKLALSQEEIANLAGMNVSNYGKIERGLGNPNFHTLVRIASVLGVDPGTLIEKIGAGALPDRAETFSAADFIRERRARRTATR